MAKMIIIEAPVSKVPELMNYSALRSQFNVALLVLLFEYPITVGYQTGMD